ncbi:DNA primase [Ralstonia pickettii]|uniref:DNA primase n=1 Tax=Ralstonia pickettii TaxID=329 RepID=A0A2N4TY03_RALPI|nr:DNA primase [Ralstonia pickettii]PLC44594.1 DNA primase [Ralstonia pickettii]
MAANEELQEALDTLDIEAWLDQEGIKYLVTRGARGLQLNVKECPVCGNSNYKVYLNADSGLGNCFHGDCEAKFNKWSFIKAVHSTLSSRQVIDHIKQVAKEQGWRPPRTVAVAVNMNTELVLPESVALPVKGRNLRYLDNRNINGTIAKYFSLRFSQRGVFRYKDAEGHSRVQDYANRIIIPIFDLKGDLVSFQGRDITGTADKKYLFPPGFASTGSVLYNGQNAIGAKRVVIGEGVFDVAATKIALDGDMALRDVVPIGSFGKHLSEGDENSQVARLVELKAKGLEQVTFLWDGEQRAIADAIKAALMLRKFGFVARVGILPPDKDPNEVPAEVVRQAFWRAEVITPASATKLMIQHKLKFAA